MIKRSKSWRKEYLKVFEKELEKRGTEIAKILYCE